MNWIKSSDTPPPKTGPFLADIGYPWPVMATWNQCQQEFVHASLQVNMVDGESDLSCGEYNDPYWENDYEKESEVIAWQSLPQIVSPKYSIALVNCKIVSTRSFAEMVESSITEFEYNGLKGSIVFSPDDQTFYGKILSIPDLIMYQGHDIKSLNQAFKDSVNDYLQFKSQCIENS